MRETDSILKMASADDLCKNINVPDLDSKCLTLDIYCDNSFTLTS